MAMEQFGLACESSDIELLTSGISKMPPFPEVVGALAELKAQGFKLCIVSNTDDDVIAGNVAQMGGHIDRVITANQAKAYKPSRRIFEHAHSALGTTKDGVIHICASPHLDLVTARDMKFRCIWDQPRHRSKAAARLRAEPGLSCAGSCAGVFSIGWA